MNLTHVDKEYELKMTAFEVDCNGGEGEPMACHHVGEFYTVVKDDFARAAKVYEKNCNEKKYGPSCFNLGRLYLGGKGVEANDDTAAQYFEKSCSKEHLQGCYHHALLTYLTADLEKGKPSEPSLLPAFKQTCQEKIKKSLDLMDWTCKEGEFESCYFAGCHYLKESNPNRDPPKAADYLLRGCAANHGPSCFNLAVMYKYGDKGVPADQAKFEEFKRITNVLVEQFGGLQGTRTA